MIYDCFTFFNEIELLKIRMNILNDVVDKFVIVEADKTLRGVPKAFNFEKIKSEFDNEYPDKIIYIKATNCPVLENSKDWAIEYFRIFEVSFDKFYPQMKLHIPHSTN